MGLGTNTAFKDSREGSMKLIDAEKLKNWIKRECNPYGAPTLDFKTSEKVMNMIDRMDNEVKWIPVTERLPEESLDSVLGWDEYRECCVFIQYIRGGFRNLGTEQSFNITAWMPVPEPYRGDSNE